MSVDNVEPASYAMVNTYALRTSRLPARACRGSLEAVKSFHTFGIPKCNNAKCQTLTLT